MLAQKLGRTLQELSDTCSAEEFAMHQALHLIENKIETPAPQRELTSSDFFEEFGGK